jgi:hypothetical protein
VARRRAIRRDSFILPVHECPAGSIKEDQANLLQRMVERAGGDSINWNRELCLLVDSGLLPTRFLSLGHHRFSKWYQWF